jgi:leucyl-tRNA synthetase
MLPIPVRASCSIRFLDGMGVDEAIGAAIRTLEDNSQGSGEVTWRLRDWGVSRQRYWGCPIPIIHCPSCGAVPVPEDQLPVTLPDDISFDQPGNPIAHHPTWKHTTCPECGGAAERETDTFDTFFEVPGISCVSLILTLRLPSPGRRWNTGCRWISISAG